MRPLLLVVVLSGCGGANFTGVWTGTLVGTSPCANSSEGSVRWTVAHRDDTLTVTPDGNCGSFTADVEGRYAVVRAKTCATVTFTGGRLELLTPEKLDVLLEATAPTCGARFTGVLRLE